MALPTSSRNVQTIGITAARIMRGGKFPSRSSRRNALMSIMTSAYANASRNVGAGVPTGESRSAPVLDARVAVASDDRD